MRTSQRWSVVGGWVAMLCLAGVQAADLATGGGMPNRISMNVTTPKQTQGATFGEKVNAGLHAAGSARGAAGAAPLVVDCAGEACTIVFPDGSGYRADLQALVLAPLEPAAPAATRKAAATLGQGASLVGAAMPGAGIVSAAVSSVGALANSGGGAAAASYARTAPPAAAPAAAGEVDLSQPLADGQYQLAVVVEKATSGLKDTLKTNVRTAPPPQVRIVVGFDVEDGVLKTRHDTARNSIGNVR